MDLTFGPGSTNGAELCAPVTADSDNLVESDEDFRVVLTMVTPTGTSFHLGNTGTVVTLTDSDGKWPGSTTLTLVLGIKGHHNHIQ